MLVRFVSAELQWELLNIFFDIFMCIFYADVNKISDCILLGMGLLDKIPCLYLNWDWTERQKVNVKLMDNKKIPPSAL